MSILFTLQCYPSNYSLRNMPQDTSTTHSPDLLYSLSDLFRTRSNIDRQMREMEELRSDIGAAPSSPSMEQNSVSTGGGIESAPDRDTLRPDTSRRSSA